MQRDPAAHRGSAGRPVERTMNSPRKLRGRSCEADVAVLLAQAQAHARLTGGEAVPEFGGLPDRCLASSAMHSSVRIDLVAHAVDAAAQVNGAS
jgi:hypothetical protein